MIARRAPVRMSGIGIADAGGEFAKADGAMKQKRTI
jgi:hypothetical protein